MVIRARRLLLSAAMLTATVTAAAAGAGTTDEEADALYAEAKQLATQGMWSEACAKLEKSHALRADMNTTYRLAECYEHVGKLASAWHKYVEAADAAKGAGETAKQEQALVFAAKIEARVPRLTIVVAQRPPGLVVKRDGVALGDADLGVAVKLDPGAHRIEAAAPGHRPFSKTITLAEGAAVMVEVPILAIDTPAPVPAPSPVSAASLEATSSPQPSPMGTIGLATAGVGGAALAVGAYLGLSARARYAEGDEHCPGGLCDREGLEASEQGQSRARTATWVLIGGGVVAVVGVTIWLTARPPDRASSPSLGLSLTPTGAWAIGRF